MPWQLIYTSAPSGLVPGRSGFCTVARHRDLSERLVAALERISIYEPASGTRPVVFTYRVLTLGNDTYGVLTRYCDAGLDYTSRRNYLAHHLVFGSGEMTKLAPPAEIARRWPAWISTWQGNPQWLSGATAAPATLELHETLLPAATWKNLTGDAGNASLLCPDGTPAEVLLNNPAGTLDDDTLLQLFAEASLLVLGGPWSVGFTTQVQQIDVPAQTPWRAGDLSDSALATARQVITPHKLGLSDSTSSVARHARTGISPEKQPHAAASPLLGKKRRTSRFVPIDENDTGEASSHPRSQNFLLAVGIGVVLAFLIGFGAWLFLLKPSDPAPPPRATTSAPASPAPGATTPSTVSAGQLTTLYASESLRRDLDAAIASQNWSDAAGAWKKLRETDASFAAQRQSDYLPLIQNQLAPALANALEKQFDALAPLFDPAAIETFRTTHIDALAQLADTQAKQTPEIKARLTRVTRQLALLDTLPATLPPLDFLVWKNHPPNNDAGDRQLRFTNQPLHAFLSRQHRALTLTFSSVNSWQDTDGTPVAVSIPAKDYQPGKALFIRQTSMAAPRIRLILNRSNGFQFERPRLASPSSALETLLAAEKTLKLAASDNTGQPPVPLLLVSPVTPPAPFKVTRDLLALDSETETISIPIWLRHALARFQLPNARLVLYPAGGADFAKNYTGPSLTRSTVEHALREGLRESTRQAQRFSREIETLEKQRQTARQTAPIDAALANARHLRELNIQKNSAIEARLARLNRQPRQPLIEQGVPWTAALIDHGSGYLLPLVVFE